MLTFPEIDPDAQRVLTVNFTQNIPQGSVLIPLPGQTGPTVTVVCTAGNDPNPGNILLAPAEYDASGLYVLQPVGNLSGLIGNDYELEFRTACTVPDIEPVQRGLLQVRAD
jgi:hypothetical protein